MSDHIVKYILCVIPLLLGAWDISGAIKGFIEGRYFVAGVELMMTVWMICLFVKVFFGL